MGYQDIFNTKNAADVKTSYFSQLAPLAARTPGTGNADTTKHEWLTNQHRDSITSYIGHDHILAYSALVEGKSQARMRYEFMEHMIEPCGPPPEEQEDEAM
ncbi:splicing factor 3b subunit 5 [Carpediemonas membranifera]|uniref:Splicing factor 3b subunit 5 n=1 Tax=Carpediemonas membranifera TaxID=201153 RepID=A0A8J6E3G5_9EUKA|nr:splicing factor 3b subunit 5 [Carpediemonas membranifera]|eukprot:KAG9393142.1 splicing factor 3b subunit 5 [Carpediemonas membranifera]